MNTSFWKEKKVLLTGHTGFKGSWLSFWLYHMGAQVIGYSLPPPTNPNLFELLDLKNCIYSIEGDVRNLKNLLSAIKKNKPEIVIHLAAQSLVLKSYKNPVETYETNVMGTINLLDSIRQTDSVRAVVNVTTDKCYENQEWFWGYREYEPMGGFDPYSNSKACSELVTSTYRNSFFPDGNYSEHGVAVATARAGNVIGGGDWAAYRLIPDCIKNWLMGKTVEIRCPSAIRPWQHVLEPLGGYLLLAEKLYQNGTDFAEAWNFGPDDESSQSVHQVVEQLSKYWYGKAEWVIKQDEKEHEANYLKLDCSKAKMKLGWTPHWNLKTALRKIAEWYIVYQKSPQDLKAITLKQIEQYLKKDHNDN